VAGLTETRRRGIGAEEMIQGRERGREVANIYDLMKERKKKKRRYTS